VGNDAQVPGEFRGYKLTRACPEHSGAPGILYALVDEDSSRLFLECDEIEHGWWDVELSTGIVGMTHLVLPHRRHADERDLVRAGWPLSLFVREEW
jgi:hypothetical protein